MDSYYPAKTSNFGIVGSIGFKKDAFYAFQSTWTDKPMVHIVPMDWDSWTAGESVYVDIYSNQPKVELFLNGTSLGASSTKDATYKFIHTVAYVEGTLSCAAHGDDGSVTATDVVKTSPKTVQKNKLRDQYRRCGH